MPKGHAELKGVVNCTVLREGRIVPLARERSHAILVRHIISIIQYMKTARNFGCAMPTVLLVKSGTYTSLLRRLTDKIVTTNKKISATCQQQPQQSQQQQPHQQQQQRSHLLTRLCYVDKTKHSCIIFVGRNDIVAASTPYNTTARSHTHHTSSSQHPQRTPGYIINRRGVCSQTVPHMIKRHDRPLPPQCHDTTFHAHRQYTHKAGVGSQTTPDIIQQRDRPPPR